jgi:nitroreductase
MAASMSPPSRHRLTDSELLRRLNLVVYKAVRAPSVHNTQPWSFVATTAGLTIRADRSRQLAVLDPSGRQLVISCGCALFNARVAAAAGGLQSSVSRLPDPSDPDLLAQLDVTAADTSDGAGEDAEIAALEPVIQVRHSNRRRFSEEPLPPELLDTLRRVAHAEGANLIEISRADDRDTIAMLTQRADALEMANPAYRAELRAWTSDDPNRDDGVPARAVPHVDAGSGDDIPIRDFDTHGHGWLPTATQSSRRQCLLILGTDADNPSGWLRAGEALERVLLEIARHGYTASLFSQIIEVPEAQAALRAELRLTTHPVMVLRVGRAQPTPGTPRRPVSDVLTEQS